MTFPVCTVCHCGSGSPLYTAHVCTAYFVWCHHRSGAARLAADFYFPHPPSPYSAITKSSITLWFICFFPPVYDMCMLYERLSMGIFLLILSYSLNFLWIYLCINRMSLFKINFYHFDFFLHYQQDWTQNIHHFSFMRQTDSWICNRLPSFHRLIG